MNNVYLDNAATTWIDPSVSAEIQRFYQAHLGNPSSIHHLGVKAAAEVERSRSEIARAIGAQPDEIIFTSGGTESNNLALKGFLESQGVRGCRVLISAIEHPSVAETAQFLESKGAVLRRLPVDENGFCLPEDLQRALKEPTALVSVMHANNEVGTIQNLQALGALCRQHGAAFHTDACQSLSRVDIDVSQMNVDLLSLSAHKIHGPSGVGALYVRKGIALVPQLHGGGQENGLRSGTLNAAGIVGFGAAIRSSRREEREHMRRLRDLAFKEILRRVPGSTVNGPLETQRLCNNLNFSFETATAKDLLFGLDRRGVFVSTGSACHSSKKKPSLVLMAMGKSAIHANESLRITLSKWTTEADIEALVDGLECIVNEVQTRSPK